jgi:antitoxin ParD1/3/4
MNVSLRPDLERLVNEKVQSGEYGSPDEVLVRALELLKEHDEAERRLEVLLPEAEDSGPATELTSADWAEIEREGLRRINTPKSA